MLDVWTIDIYTNPSILPPQKAPSALSAWRDMGPVVCITLKVLR